MRSLRATRSDADPATRESITWGRVHAGVDVMAVAHSSRLFHVVLDGYLLGALTVGEVDWHARGERLVQTVGDVVLGEPGEVYVSDRHRVAGSWEALFLAPAIVAQAASELNVPAPEALHLTTAQVHDPALAAAVRRVHTAETALASDVALSACLHRLLGHYGTRRPVTRLRTPVVGAAQAVRRAREFLHAHVVGPVSLDVLAGVAGVSKYHLVRAFRRVVGLPPHAYQIQLKVALARQLIGTGMPLSRVALAVGFAGQSHLHRHFMRVVGVAPGAYGRRDADGGRKNVEDGRPMHA